MLFWFSRSQLITIFFSPDGPEEVKVTGENGVEITESVNLKCVAKSLPAATFVWKFNGTLTQVTSPDYVMEGAVYKNTGIYTCEATNAITGLTMSAAHLLSVKGKTSRPFLWVATPTRNSSYGLGLKLALVTSCSVPCFGSSRLVWNWNR